MGRTRSSARVSVRSSGLNGSPLAPFWRRAMKPVVWRTLGTAIAVAALCVAFVHAQPVFTKAQVGERIRKVEDGVDEFRKYLERRGDEAHDRKDTAQKDTAQKSGKSGRRGA